MKNFVLKFKEYSEEKQQEIINRFKSKINDLYIINNEDHLFSIIYCLDYAFNYINEKYSDESKLLRTWSIVMLMRYMNKNNINNEEDIINIIDKTYNHLKNNEYDVYLNDIAFFATEYDRDLEYINKIL
jgi:hypothetical protein